jgi:HK97 family phage portal protein
MLNSLRDNIRRSLGYEERTRETKPTGGTRYTAGGSISWMNPASGKTGIFVNPEIALTYSAVYSAVNLLTTTCCSLPLRKYKKLGENGDIEEVFDVYTWLINVRPNPEMDSRTFFEVMISNLLTRGNAYAEKEFDLYDDVKALWPIPSQYITPMRMEDGSIWYAYVGPTGQRKLLPAEKILHVKDFSLDGFIGLSRITLARLSIELGLSQESVGVSLMANDGRPSGVITTPVELDDEDLESFKKEWKEQGQGLLNKGKTIVLEKGMAYQTISLSPKDTEFITSRNFQIEEIARWFRVPPHMLYDLTRSTYSNIEKQSQDFATYSLLPILDRFIAAYMFEFYVERDYAKVMNRRKFNLDIFLEYDLSGLLRADSKVRHEVYKMGSEIGMYSPNDCLRAERKDTIGNEGNIRTVSTNRILLSKVKDNGTKPTGNGTNSSDDGTGATGTKTDSKSSGNPGSGQKPGK